MPGGVQDRFVGEDGAGEGGADGGVTGAVQCRLAQQHMRRAAAVTARLPTAHPTARPSSQSICFRCSRRPPAHRPGRAQSASPCRRAARRRRRGEGEREARHPVGGGRRPQRRCGARHGAGLRYYCCHGAKDSAAGKGATAAPRSTSSVAHARLPSMRTFQPPAFHASLKLDRPRAEATYLVRLM